MLLFNFINNISTEILQRKDLNTYKYEENHQNYITSYFCSISDTGNKRINIVFNRDIQGVAVDVFLVAIHSYRINTNSYYYDNTIIKDWNAHISHVNTKMCIDLDSIPGIITYFYFQIYFLTGTNSKVKVMLNNIYSIKENKVFIVKPSAFYNFIKNWSVPMKKSMTNVIFSEFENYNITMDAFVHGFEMTQFMNYVLGICLAVGILAMLMSYFISHRQVEEKQRKDKGHVSRLEDIFEKTSVKGGTLALTENSKI